MSPMTLVEKKVFSHPFGDGALRELVHMEEQMSLYRYQPEEVKHPLPICVCYALVNKPYVLDLSPKRSFIRGLLKEGFVVYLVEWEDPKEDMSNPDLEEYVRHFLHEAVLATKAKEQVPQINLLGICQGGSFALMYTALHQENIANLITMVTPVDFQKGDNIFAHFARRWDTYGVRETWQRIPGNFMNSGFLQLKPFELMVGKYLGSAQIMDKPAHRDLFTRMEKWVFDSPDQSGACWEQFIRECYKENKLVKNELWLGKHHIDLHKITCPVLNLIADKDHMVPPPASLPLGEVLQTKDYNQESFPVGHIGIFVSGVSRKKVVPKIASWLQERGGKK